MATLIREGKPSEARRIMDEVDAAFPTEHLQSSEIGLWLKWSEGQRTAALVAQFDDLVAKKRLEARTTVESRALLPITLARAAAVHHAAGQGTQAAKLSAEALRMAPAPWKTMLKEISSSR